MDGRRRRLEDRGASSFDYYVPRTDATPTPWLALSTAIVALALLYVIFHVFCLPSWKKFGHSSDGQDDDPRGTGNSTAEGDDHEVPSDGTGPLSETDHRQLLSSNGGSPRSLGQSRIDPQESASLLQLRPDTQPPRVPPAGIHPPNNAAPTARAAAAAAAPSLPPPRSLIDDSGLQAPSTTDRGSAVPSTTSRHRRRPASALAATGPDTPHSIRRQTAPILLRSWDLSRLAWTPTHNRGRPLSRAESVRRSVQHERQFQTQLSFSEEGSHDRSRSSWNSQQQPPRPGNGRLWHSHHPPSSHRGVSDVASNVLDEGNVEGEAQFYRQRYMERNQRYRNPNNNSSSSSNSGRVRRHRGPHSSASSVRSALPVLSPDDISPDEAADAHDPGTLNVGYTDGYQNNGNYFATTASDSCFNCCDPVGNLLDYSDLDFETRRILTLTFPATIEAAMDPLFRMGVVVVLSNFLDTDSMVAFLLVSLLLRMSAEEIAGALVDAQSSFVQEALAQGGNLAFTMAGSSMQLGIQMQFLCMVPVLVLWAFLMEDVIMWLIPESPGIAQAAADYAQIIVIDFYIKALSRSFMLVFHLTGQAQFELNVDLSMTAVTIALVSIASSASSGISLEGIAWIQVVVTLVSAVGKAIYLYRKGLVKPYEQGLTSDFALRDLGKVKVYLSVFAPLLVGSLVETGEWQILVLFIQRLGGAEVSVWAMMGIVWEICEAFTEGLGEGAAVRISYYLSENLPDLAEQLANKAVFLSIMESTILTAIFLMIGPNLSVALSKDAVLQNLFNELMPMIALANMSMSLAQIYWSIVGAQGHFSRASAVILADRWFFIIPLSCILIYSSTFDLLSVAGVVAVGYALGSVVLARMVFQCNWSDVAAELHDDFGEDEAAPADVDDEDEDESESEDDSSTGFG